MKQSILQQQQHNKQIIINKRYIIQNYKRKIEKYQYYQGMDMMNKERVIIYAKLDKNSEIQEKENKRIQIFHKKLSKILPKILWFGSSKIQNYWYHIIILQKLGPELKDVLQIINFDINLPTLYVLIYNLLQLIEEIQKQNLIFKIWKFSKICLNKKIESTELCVNNIFQIKNKSQISGCTYQKYSSISSHLGLKSSFKDDLQSLCYIIFDLFTKKTFFKSPYKLCTEKKKTYYLELKNDIEFSKLKLVPSEYISFYLYCRNLSLDQSPNFQYWKKCFKNLFMPQLLKLPYNWQNITVDHNDQISEKENSSYKSFEQFQVELGESKISEVLSSIDLNFITKKNRLINKQ